MPKTILTKKDFNKIKEEKIRLLKAIAFHIERKQFKNAQICINKYSKISDAEKIVYIANNNLKELI